MIMVIINNSVWNHLRTELFILFNVIKIIPYLLV